ncbi:MAG: YggS family pyridoxal phosphate-dependent enzyme [Planctomycetia bacterium]
MSAAAAERIAENLAAIRGRMADAARQAGRDPAGVTLIAVTKYVPVAIARLVAAAGCRDLAESRPQALWERAEALGDLAPPIRWHLVGHLQRNKIRRTLAPAPLIHSLDSLRLLETLEGEAAAAGQPCAALVEVNLADAAARTGAKEQEAATIVAAAASLRHVRLQGLMGMASVPDGDPGAARREFARLRELRDRFAATLPGGESLRDLSMGMSGDFPAAILEGATMIRVGSAIFAGVEP